MSPNENMLGTLVRALPHVPPERRRILLDTVHKLSNAGDVEFPNSLKALLRKQESAASIMSAPPPAPPEKGSAGLPTYDEMANNWPRFCNEFRLAIPRYLMGMLHEKKDENPGCWPVFVPSEFSADDALSICSKLFPVALKSPLNAFSVTGVGAGCIAMCAASLKPDPKWMNKSAATLINSRCHFMDVRERCWLEAYYFWLTRELRGVGCHLDHTGTRTRCPSSRDPNGNISSCGHDGTKFCVEWSFPTSHMHYAGAREVVRYFM